MALNPPLTMSGDPCRVEGEFFVMKRKGVEFEFKVENGSKYTGEGYVILTTARMVCINKKTNSLFKAFDIPLAYITNEKFEQPIFGANYVKGTVKPLFNLLPGNINFKIWFSEGGFGTFVPGVFNLINSIKKNNYKGVDSKLMSSITSGTFSKTAYVDPNDPSVIYLEQPEVINNNTSNNNQNFSGFGNQQQFNNNQVNTGFVNQQQQQFSNNQMSSGYVNQQQQLNTGYSNFQNQPQNFPQQQYGVNNNQYSGNNSSYIPPQNLNNNQQFQYNQQYNNNQQFNQDLSQQQQWGTGQNQGGFGTNTNYNQQFPNYNTSNQNTTFNNQSQVGYQMTTQTQPILINNQGSSNLSTNPPMINMNSNQNYNPNNQVNYPDLNTQNNMQIQQNNQSQQGQQQPQQQTQPTQPSNPKYFGFFGPDLKKNN